MRARVVRVLRRTKFDFATLSAGGAVSMPVPQTIEASQMPVGVLMVRVHSANVGSGSDGDIRVHVKQSGRTAQDPARLFTGETLATIVAAQDGTTGPAYETRAFSVDGSELQVEVEGVQDSANSLALDASISIDLKLDVGDAPPLVRLSDGTFARASKAWWVSDDGSRVLEYDSGVLRIPEAGRYAIEGAVTNQVVDSAVLNFGSSAWGAAGSPAPTITDDASASPRAGDDADEVVFGTSGASRIQETMTAARLGGLSGQNVASVFYKRGSAGTDDMTVRLDLSDGTNDSHTVTPSSAWQRDEHDFTNGATDSATERVRLQNAAANANNVLVWGVMSQYDAPHIRTSYVETSGSTASKVADDLSFANVRIPAKTLKDGFWFRWWPYFTSAEHVSYNVSQRLLDFATGSNAFIGLDNGVAQLQIRNDADATNVQRACTWSLRSELTLVVDFTNGEMRLSGFDTGDGTVSITSIDWSAIAEDLQIGALHSALSQPYWGDISDLYPLSTAPA